MDFICYPRCTTCQKARKFLESKEIKFNQRDIKLENPNFDELQSLYKISKLPLKRFFNTSGNIYKSLNLKERLPQMSEDEQLRLLASDGMLIKRPLLVCKDFVLVGFNESEWESQITSYKQQVPDPNV